MPMGPMRNLQHLSTLEQREAELVVKPVVPSLDLSSLFSLSCPGLVIALRSSRSQFTCEACDLSDQQETQSSVIADWWLLRCHVSGFISHR